MHGFHSAFCTIPLLGIMPCFACQPHLLTQCVLQSGFSVLLPLIHLLQHNAPTCIFPLLCRLPMCILGGVACSYFMLLPRSLFPSVPSLCRVLAAEGVVGMRKLFLGVLLLPHRGLSFFIVAHDVMAWQLFVLPLFPFFCCPRQHKK